MTTLLRPSHPIAFFAILTIATATVMLSLGTARIHAQDQTPAPEWYDQEKVDAWGRNLVDLLNAGKASVVLDLHSERGRKAAI